MKQTVNSFVMMLLSVTVLSAAGVQATASAQFGSPQFCDGSQIQSVLVTEKKRFAGGCRHGLSTTPAGELAFAFFVEMPSSFVALSPIFDVVTISENGATSVFTSPLVGTIRVSKPFWTSTQDLVISFKRFRIERNAGAIWFVLQEGDANWADNYMQSLQEFVD